MHSSFKFVFFAALTTSAAEVSSPFRGGLEIEGRRCHTVRIPAMATVSNGDLVMVFDARWNNINDAITGKGEETEIAVSRSTDGGRSWSAPKILHDFPWNGTVRQAAGDPSLIVDRETKTIFCFYNMHDHVRRPRKSAPWMQFSTDNGMTWSEPKDFSGKLTLPEWKNDKRFITSGNGTQLRDGTLLHTFNWVTAHKACVFGSTDHGKTWRFFGMPVGPADENKIVELDDGAWMLNCRSSEGYLREVYVSRDRGKTWETRRDPGLLDTGANGGILNYRFPDGRKALVLSNCHSEGRKNLTLKTSFDGGMTWPRTLSVWPGIAAYSEMAELPDGRLALVYEAGDKNLYERFDVAVFKPEELAGEVDAKNILREVRSRYETALVGDLAAWWLALSLDKEHGGFLTCLDREGKPYDGKKHLWMQAREVWMFARLFNSRFRQQRFLDAAEMGYGFLKQYAHRPDGCCHYLLKRNGSPRSDDGGGCEKFTESFLAIAAAELYRATKKDEYAAEAKRAFDAYREAIQAKPSGYDQLAYPISELNTLQEMRAAFSGYDAEIDEAIKRVRRFARPSDGLFFERAPSGGGFDTETQYGRFSIPGHAFEGLSFIMHRLVEKPDPELRDFVLKETKAMHDFGRDPVDGAVWYCMDVERKPMANHDWFLKAWWPQAEAAAAMMRAYALSGDRDFLKRFLELDTFIRTELRDPKFHEYYAYAPVAGRAFHDYKGSESKGFFHLPRYFLTVIETIDRILPEEAAAIQTLTDGKGTAFLDAAAPLDPWRCKRTACRFGCVNVKDARR